MSMRTLETCSMSSSQRWRSAPACSGRHSMPLRTPLGSSSSASVKTSLRQVVDGSSNLKSRSALSSTVTNARAPVFSLTASSATRLSADFSAFKVMPYPSKSFSNCLRTECSASVRILYRSLESRASIATRTGTRPTNSGSKPASMKSDVSARWRKLRVPADLEAETGPSPALPCGTGSPSPSTRNPMVCCPTRSLMRSFKALNAPLKMKSMNLVETLRPSFEPPPRTSLRLACNGFLMLTSVSSIILRKLLCTCRPL
mmetsp:Transcript_27536/g.74642  ORF Transcript_27536/g.74642 Transcript_27536/m.74642 type:complete len:258 (+) Transcript_27536:396-1169(+)